MDMYPLLFEPLLVEKIWGGRNLERLFGRALPEGKDIGESWELTDLPNGVSVVRNGPLAGTSLTDLTRMAGTALLGGARAGDDGRFPLLLKLLDANDILSLQVHPDAEAVARIGPDAALKTECWYVLESREGFIYKGVKPGAKPQQFRQAIEADQVQELVRRVDVAAGDFYFLPAGTVHALGKGVVVAEVQTPSDTTYRVTDWGRGREIHVDRSMECIHFVPSGDEAPGASGDTLLTTDYFTVARRRVEASGEAKTPAGKCCALMMLSAGGPVQVSHSGAAEPATSISAGDTILLPAALKSACLSTPSGCEYLEITLPEAG